MFAAPFFQCAQIRIAASKIGFVGVGDPGIHGLAWHDLDRFQAASMPPAVFSSARPPFLASPRGHMSVRPLTRVIEGMLWSHYFPEQCVRSALAYEPLPGDVFVVSYPKCGTTWLQYIVYNIYSGGVPPRNREQFWDNTPFLEMRGAERSILRSKPGAIKTHLPFDRQPYSPQAKYAVLSMTYITAAGKSCCSIVVYSCAH
ncbi:hypothetical protein HPB51_019940 [Rhipicephalus microplus]|uniref:Sulfotransferase domain-containing protein n=1 Tax=Rhipicephalus microplus TaxID=6941 RepID=A0A9J6E2T0_RHIMP|nr:hypothetical protein HPB51_019940 [Rhipicephalus microplus]